MRKSTKRILKKLFKPLNLINCFLYKRKKQILLYSNLGFRDNIKALYDYLIENGYNKKYRIIISLNDYKSNLNCVQKNVRVQSNLIGLFSFLFSKYVFYCFGSVPVKPSKKQIVINLWHGMPLKRIGLLDQKNKQNKYFFFSKVLATSEFFSPFMSSAFGCDEDHVLICGQPRNDYLFKKIDLKKCFLLDNICKFFIWMPTFRTSKDLDENNGTNGRVLPLIDSLDSFDFLNDYLKERKGFLFIKLHPMQDKLFDKREYSNILFIDDKIIESKCLNLYEFLSGFDALITDYSSVFFDFILLNRPMCFTIDDINEYHDSRGFVVDDPKSLMPGFYASDLSDLVEFFDCVFSGNDLYKKKRELLIEKFHKYPDGNNTKRLLEACSIEV